MHEIDETVEFALNVLLPVKTIAVTIMSKSTKSTEMNTMLELKQKYLIIMAEYAYVAAKTSIYFCQ